MRTEPFRFLRFIFVIATLTPLFILWSLKGVKGIPDIVLWTLTLSIVALSNGIVFLRWQSAKRQNLLVQSKVIEATDHREHLVVYLLAVLLAMYGISAESFRELSGVIFILLLIILLFWFSNLHYLNIVFAIFGYKTFTVTRKHEDSSERSTSKVVVLTKRAWIEAGDLITCYRLSHDIWIEK